MAEEEFSGYCSVESVRLALAPTADGKIESSDTDASSPSKLQVTQLQDAILEAMGVVDTYIDVPTPVPSRVGYLTRNIAAYLATLSYRESKDITDEDPIVRRYNNTMALLKGIRDGSLEPVKEKEDPTVFNPYVGNLWGPENFALGGTDWPFHTPAVRP